MRDAKKLDYYDILHLSPTATELEIKSQYRRLSKRYHPDMGGSQASMTNINEAYHVLSDQFRRSLYDAERRRALRVPPREPAQPVHMPQHKQPTSSPYAHTTKQTTPKRKRSWWAALSWSFAVVVILIGILLQLPLAEAKGSSGTTQTTAKPLSVNYPSDGSSDSSTATNAPPSTNSTFYSTPDGINYSAPATSQPTDTQSSQSQQTTSSSCASDSCRQTRVGTNCATKTASLYKRTVCSSASGSCATSTVDTHRYTSCY